MIDESRVKVSERALSEGSGSSFPLLKAQVFCFVI